MRTVLMGTRLRAGVRLMSVPFLGALMLWSGPILAQKSKASPPEAQGKAKPAKAEGGGAGDSGRRGSRSRGGPGLR